MLKRDRFGATLLHWAVRFANIDAIAVLLAAGADVNALCLDGSSVLAWASYSWSEECCRAILRAGADVHHRDANGCTAIMHSLLDFPTVNEDFVDLLLEAGSEVEASSMHQSVLNMAVLNASTSVCKKILDFGASMDQVDANGFASVHFAILFHRHSTLRLLVKRGASLNGFTKEGHSILHYAAKGADIQSMGILQEAHIEGLSIDAVSLKTLWECFHLRHDTFLGVRAPVHDEAIAFQALLNSVIPRTALQPSIKAETLSVPGAFPQEVRPNADEAGAFKSMMTVQLENPALLRLASLD